jgi:hypothetical protein
VQSNNANTPGNPGNSGFAPGGPSPNDAGPSSGGPSIFPTFPAPRFPTFIARTADPISQTKTAPDPGPSDTSCIASGTGVQTALPAIDFGSVLIGSAKEDKLLLGVKSGSIILTSVKLVPDSANAFFVKDLKSCTPITGDALIGLIDFIPPPGATGLLEATLQLFDANNNEFDIKLSGEATISEPLTLVLFGFALGGLAFARRLRL